MRLLIMLVVMVGGSAWAGEKPGLAALNIKAERGVDASLATLISEAILSELKSSGRFATVIGSSDIEAMINIEQQKQALGCEEDNCLAQLGGALGVPYLFTGSLGSVGGRFMLNLKILQVEEARVAERMTRIYTGEAALVDGLKPALEALLKGSLLAGKEPAPKSVVVPKIQAAPKAEVASKPSPKAGPASEPKGRPWGRWMGGALGVVGVGLTATSYLHFTSAQADHDADPTVATAENLALAVESGNTGIGTGLGALGAGLAAWMWLP